MNENAKKLYQAKADVLKALGHPTRLLIVEKLEHREFCVCEFTAMIGADFSTVSKHLTILKQAGIVTDEKRGKQVFYKLKARCLLPFINCIETVLQSKLQDQIEMLG